MSARRFGDRRRGAFARGPVRFRPLGVLGGLEGLGAITWLAAALLVGCEGKKPTAPAAPSAQAAAAPAAAPVAPVAPAPAAPAAAPATQAAPVAAAPAAAPATQAAPVAAAAAAPKSDEEPTLEELLENADRDLERGFDELKDSTADAISDDQRRSIARALTELLGVPTTVKHPIAMSAEGQPLAAYVLYAHAARAGCEGCLSQDELDLNPGCKAHGVAFARAEEDVVSVVAMPLATGGCDLRVRHWFVAHLGGRDTHADAFLEVVSSKVTERRRSKKKDQVTTSRRQSLAIWEDPDTNTGGIAEPTFTLDVEEWESRPWRSRERPALDSVLLSPSSRAMRVVHLLPCYDPWSHEACNADLRKRKVYEY